MTGQAAVAAGHAVTADAAADILSDGGNAFDAALGAMLTACIPEVVLASIGGGGCLMAYVAERGELRLYDFFVQTPRHKKPISDIDFRPICADFGPATQEFHIGAGSAATPGMVPGLYAVHADLARLPMARIAEPAIHAARSGVPMSGFHAYLFQVIPSILKASPEAEALFAPHGDMLGEGEIYRNPDLADTLEALVREGPGLFSHGEVARAILRQSDELGGQLCAADLEEYQVVRRHPMIWRMGDAAIALNPPPAASGPLIAFSLALADHLRTHGTPLDAVARARIMQQTNAARAEAGEALAELADPDRLTAAFAALDGLSPAYRGTTHISVVDREGNAAAVTFSNGESNGLVVPGTGFMLNNMLGEEDLFPNGFHRWTPNQRLSTMMAPTLIRQNDVLTAMGSGGSNRIRTAILQVALDLIVQDMPLARAVAAPRVHVEKCDTVSYEGTLEAGERDRLLHAFPDAHGWPEPNMFFGGVHTVRRLADGSVEAVADFRRLGAAQIV